MRPWKILLALGLLFAPFASRANQYNAQPSQNISGTITTGGTFQQIAPSALGTRTGCQVQNPTTATEVLYVFFGPLASATVGKSFSLAPGASISCSAGTYIVSDAISVEAATTSHAFTAAIQ